MNIEQEMSTCAKIEMIAPSVHPEKNGCSFPSVQTSYNDTKAGQKWTVVRRMCIGVKTVGCRL